MSDEQHARPPMLYGREEFKARTPAAIQEAHKRVITIDDRHRRKAAVILDYAKRYHCSILVETGTAYGEMVETVRGQFERIWTVELKQDWYELARANFADCPNVTPLLGDSAEALAWLKPQIDQPAIFYLDAHYSAGSTARGREDTPIMRELDVILSNLQLPHVIIIDDLLSFQKDPAYPRPAELRDYIKQRNPGAQVEELAEMIAVIPQPILAGYETSLTCQIPGLDGMYRAAFGLKRDGVFVEVGANDGYFCSNVWGLARAGWRGLCFEPEPEMAVKCRKAYQSWPNVTVLQNAVGDRAGQVDLYPGITSTTSLEVVNKKSWGFDYGDPLKVEMVTLNAALKANKFPRRFDVLSIDVDGAELEVLNGLSLTTWQPHWIILEVCKDHPVESYHVHTVELENRMKQSGYIEIWHDAINSIFERQP